MEKKSFLLLLMENIDAFCSDPTLDNFWNLSAKTQKLFYTYAMEVKKIGNKKLAHIVEHFYITSEDAKRGIQAILLAVKYLLTIPPLRATIKVNIYKRIQRQGRGWNEVSAPIFTITKSGIFPILFNVKDETETLNELNLTEAELREHIVNTISKNKIVVQTIDIISKGNGGKPFYSNFSGVIWGLEDCEECRCSLAEKIPIRCPPGIGCDEQSKENIRKFIKRKKKFQECERKLVDKNCMSKVRVPRRIRRENIFGI